MQIRQGGGPSDYLEFLGRDGQPIASAHASDVWGHQLEVYIPRTDKAGDPGVIDLTVDGDFGAGLRVHLETKRGGGSAATQLAVQVGNMDVFTIDGAGNVWAAGTLQADGGVV